MNLLFVHALKIILFKKYGIIWILPLLRSILISLRRKVLQIKFHDPLIIKYDKKTSKIHLI